MPARLRPQPRFEIEDERVITPAELELMADSTREFLYNALVDEPRTATELAALLGCPTTRLYHHLKRLEQAGLIRVVAERIVSGIVERRYRAVARRLRLDRQAFGLASPENRELNTLLDYVFERARGEIETAHRVGRIDLSKKPTEAGALQAYRTVLKLKPEAARELARRLHALYLEFEESSMAPEEADGELLGVVLASYPVEPSAAQAPRRRGAQGRRSRNGGRR